MLHFSIRPASFNGLVGLGQRLLKTKKEIFVFKSQFIRPFCVAYLNQIIDGFNPDLKIHSTYPCVNQYLKQIRFRHLFNEARAEGRFPQDDVICLERFNGDTNLLSKKVPQWLEKEVFSKPFAPNFSVKLRKKVVKNLWEIVCNTIQHSESVHGISCCGQFYPQMGYFEIAFFDQGIGIPHCVRYYKKELEEYSDHDCLKWALKKGTTTKPELDSGGLGLYYLREFLKLNGGYLQIYSHRGFYQDLLESLTYPKSLKNFIQGTLFNIRIIYDENIYHLKGE